MGRFAALGPTKNWFPEFSAFTLCNPHFYDTGSSALGINILLFVFFFFSTLRNSGLRDHRPFFRDQLSSRSSCREKDIWWSSFLERSRSHLQLLRRTSQRRCGPVEDRFRYGVSWSSGRRIRRNKKNSESLQELSPLHPEVGSTQAVGGRLLAWGGTFWSLLLAQKRTTRPLNSFVMADSTSISIATHNILVIHYRSTCTFMWINDI